METSKLVDQIVMNKQIKEAEKKSMVLTILERCKKELTGLVVPLADYEDRVSYYTSLPISYVKYVNKTEGKFVTNKNQLIPLDIFDRIKILDCMKTIYASGLTLKFHELYQEIKKQSIPVPDLEHFRYYMYLMGFKYRETRTSGLIIMEEPKLAFERYHYLSKLRKLRNTNKNFYYIEARVLNSNLSFDKHWYLNKDKGSWGESIFLHVISGNAYHTGLFISPVTEDDFIKWITNIVLPTLIKPSVVVLDKNPLHWNDENIPITEHHSKSDMLNWLDENNIPYSSDMRKPELFELVNRFSNKRKENKIDVLFKANGHDILRLPSKYYDLSPAELLWQHIKKTIRVEDCNLLTLQDSILSILENIPKELWKNFESAMIEKENEIFSIDAVMEESLEKLQIIKTGSVFDNCSHIYDFYNINT